MCERQLTLEEQWVKRLGDTLESGRRVEISLDDFDGRTYEHAQDYARLKTQLGRVRHLLLSPPGGWWTLSGLRERAGGTEASISARVRDLRKPRFGGYDVERRRMGGGLWVYRIKEAA